MNTLVDNFAAHPGVFIQDEIEARGWSLRNLAFVLGRPEKFLNQILSGKASITSELARKLSKVFGVSVDLFLNLQNSYDSSTSKILEANAKRIARLQSPYPVSEMISRGWLRISEHDSLESELAHFLEVSNVNQLSQISAGHGAKSAQFSDTCTSQLAWLCRVRQLARTIAAPKFSKQRLRNTLPLLRDVMEETEQVQYVPELLEKCGVRLVIVERLKGVKFCGVTSWLSKTEPVIGLTTRFDRIDNFWFVLRHTVEHVLRGHGYKKPCFDGDRELDVDGNVEEEDRIANQASLDFSIPSDEFNVFISKYESRITRSEILAFAKEKRVHPGIVAGRVQNYLNRQDVFNDLKSKYRQKLVQNSVYDGWGVIPPV